jgi:signal transduction histidine kinase
MGGISDELWRALESAASSVTTDWRAISVDTVSVEEAGAMLAHLMGAAMRLASGEEPDEGSLPRSVLGRRLLGLLRRQLIGRAIRLDPAPDSRQLLALLTSLEDVGHRIESDWSQHFADTLAGPDGLELVVEVAHDFRSPVTSILFLAETLQKGRSGPVTELQERQLGLIYSAAFGLSGVASDVIELARGGDRLVDLDPIPFSIADIFESVRDIVQPIAEEKGLEVQLLRPEADLRVGHPVALSRVLLNLTTNALKFTDAGCVELGGRRLEGHQVEFWVRDTGRGIPPQAMLTLYEPFRRRQHAGEYAFSGSGLGLSICRKLVEAMGGELKVETEAGKGTRFIFQIGIPPAPSGPAD